MRGKKEKMEEAWNQSKNTFREGNGEGLRK